MRTTNAGGWRKSSFSGTNGDCVEIAETGDTVAVRNSNHPDAGTLTFATSAVAAFIDSAKSGEYDDLST